MRNHLDPESLESLFAASGVAVTREDIEAVARSVARINQAAAALFATLSFDETVEQFYRLLNVPAEKGSRD